MRRQVPEQRTGKLCVRNRNSQASHALTSTPVACKRQPDGARTKSARRGAAPEENCRGSFRIRAGSVQVFVRADMGLEDFSHWLTRHPAAACCIWWGLGEILELLQPRQRLRVPRGSSRRSHEHQQQEPGEARHLCSGFAEEGGLGG